MRLTSKTVAALDLTDGKDDAIYFDDELPGFGYRLRRSGGKVRRSWIAQYRHGGRTRRLLLGSAEVLTPERARAAAKTALAKVALGEDPQEFKASQRRQQGQTLRALVDDFLELKRTTVRKPTFVNLALYLRGPYFKPLHGMAVDAITRRDVAARLVAITRNHSSIVAVRARGALSSFYVWALGNGFAESNPIVGTLKPQDAQPRSRVLRDDELAAIWHASGDTSYGKVIKLLMLTGARRAEVGGMRWSELDLDRGTWMIPASRSKNKKPHELPLCSLALEMIASTPHLVSRDHLFGARSAEGLRHWHAKADLDQRLGDRVGAWRLHDLRRTLATRLGDFGTPPHVVECILGHTTGGTRSSVAAIYNRSNYQREVQAALALWDDHVRSIVNIGSERKIVPIAVNKAR